MFDCSGCRDFYGERNRFVLSCLILYLFDRFAYFFILFYRYYATSVVESASVTYGCNYSYHFIRTIKIK